MPTRYTMRTLDDCLRWLDSIDRAREVKTTGAWPLAAILEHCAQSIEMSIDGFPSHKSALFQKTAGRAAFNVFRWRGRMSHGLAEAIPGAPALTAGAEWKPSAQRLRSAMARFGAHAGAMAPHFAYGALSKRDYELAHSMHIANHCDEIVAAA